MAELEARFAGEPVPRPPTWGGSGSPTERVEFWQNREDRLHDRLLYLAGPEGLDDHPPAALRGLSRPADPA